MSETGPSQDAIKPQPQPDVKAQQALTPRESLMGIFQKEGDKGVQRRAIKDTVREHQILAEMQLKRLAREKDPNLPNDTDQDLKYLAGHHKIMRALERDKVNGRTYAFAEAETRLALNVFEDAYQRNSGETAYTDQDKYEVSIKSADWLMKELEKPSA